ncbi:MAG: DUF58 domain-containing protein, partial [Myxococcales bacterium]|nr:DUF58 domain-containing protein [Myxococcales bacterium]
GLFEKSREIESDGELVIYPAVDPVRLPQHGRGEMGGDAGPLGRGAGEEIFALRAMRDGDDPRDIYWRKSTIPGQPPVLRERAREMRHEVELYIDVHKSDLTSKAPERAAKSSEPRAERDTAPPGVDRFERRIREVASYAVAHIKRGDRVTIHTSAGERAISDRSRGIDPVLRFLALLEQVEGGRGPTTPEEREAAA